MYLRSCFPISILFAVSALCFNCGTGEIDASDWGFNADAMVYADESGAECVIDWETFEPGAPDAQTADPRGDGSGEGSGSGSGDASGDGATASGSGSSGESQGEALGEMARGEMEPKAQKGSRNLAETAQGAATAAQTELDVASSQGSQGETGDGENTGSSCQGTGDCDGSGQTADASGPRGCDAFGCCAFPVGDMAQDGSGDGEQSQSIGGAESGGQSQGGSGSASGSAQR